MRNTMCCAYKHHTENFSNLQKELPSSHDKTCIGVANSSSKLPESTSITCVGVCAE